MTAPWPGAPSAPVRPAAPPARGPDEKPRGRRVVGVDTARGLAVLGMFVAHLGLERSTELASTTGWFWIADGRSSALFATLAGVGLAFMTKRAYASGEAGEYRTQRVRILKRSAVLMVLGWALVLLGTPVAVILGAYAVLFVLALPFLRLRPAALLGVAAGVVLVMPTLVLATRIALLGSADHGGYSEVGQLMIVVPGIAELWSGYYPALSWLTYILVGLAIGRLGLTSARLQGVLVCAGAAVAAVGYGAGVVLEEAVGAAARPFVSIEPHADSTPEILGNLGVAVAVTGLCLLLTTRISAIRVLLTPISATGAMSLTVYSLHIVYIRVLGNEAVYNPLSNWPLIGLVLVTLVATTVWQLTIGQGPLERALSAMMRPRTPAGQDGPPGSMGPSGPPPGGAPWQGPPGAVPPVPAQQQWVVPPPQQQWVAPPPHAPQQPAAPPPPQQGTYPSAPPPR